MKVENSLLGAAGEYLVLSRLLSRGYLAAPAPRGTRKVDILVNHIDGGAPTLIQVKTTQKGIKAGWVMGEKNEKAIDDDLFYCLVDFRPENPTVHVIPSRVVAETLSENHQIWLDTPGRNGQEHQATNMRVLGPKTYTKPENWLDEYLENWSLLPDLGS